MTDRLRPWWPVALWCVMILVLTTLPWSQAQRASLPVDKVAHFFLYAVLGWLVGSALRKAGWTRIGAVVSAAAAVGLFALGDELHQAWVPTRVPAVEDWLADMAGGAVGLLAVLRRGTGDEHREEGGTGSAP